MGKVWYIERSFGEESASWRPREGPEGQGVEDAVIVRYYILNLNGDAKDVLEMDWKRNKKDWYWIKPTYLGFTFNLDNIRNTFGELSDLDWLQGEIEIEPIVTYPGPQIINNEAEMEFVIKGAASMKPARLSENVTGAKDNPYHSGKPSGGKRVIVPADIQTTVLTKSGRRCCICFGLNRDTSVKTGQIAHLDRNPENNELENLAWLCLEHHNQYDSRTSVSKNFTMQEVKEYRDDLYSALPSGVVQTGNGNEGPTQMRNVSQSVNVSGGQPTIIVAGGDIVPKANNAGVEQAIDNQKTNGEMKFDGKVYWLQAKDGSKEGPYCQLCWERDKKRIHLKEESRGFPVMGTLSGRKSKSMCYVCYVCPNCKMEVNK